jgi:hypothetical protein
MGNIQGRWDVPHPNIKNGWAGGVLNSTSYKKLLAGLRDAPHPLLNWVGWVGMLKAHGA